MGRSARRATTAWASGFTTWTRRLDRLFGLLRATSLIVLRQVVIVWCRQRNNQLPCQADRPCVQTMGNASKTDALGTIRAGETTRAGSGVTLRRRLSRFLLCKMRSASHSAQASADPLGDAAETIGSPIFGSLKCHPFPVSSLGLSPPPPGSSSSSSSVRSALGSSPSGSSLRPKVLLSPRNA